MAKYIPIDQMTKLREAAKNGDEMAKKILRAQLDDVSDFSADLEEYFKPKEEPQPEPEEIKEEVKVEQQPIANPITGDGIVQSEISEKILDLIGACDKKTLELANDSEISDATKKGALSILGEIKQSCLDNLEKFGKLMSSLSKKSKEEENVEEITQLS